MNFLRKTLLTTNNLTTVTVDSDVELEDLESGGRTASLPLHQPPTAPSAFSFRAPQTVISTITPGPNQAGPSSDTPSFHPLTASAPSAFSFCAPQTVISTVTPGPNQPGPSSDTPSFHLSPQTPQTAISTITLQASRKRAHQIEEHNDRVRIIELGPTIESTKVILILILDFSFLINYIAISEGCKAASTHIDFQND